MKKNDLKLNFHNIFLIITLSIIVILFYKMIQLVS